MNTTVTFRTEKQLKEDASRIFESMGMTLSTALNLFMKQAVIKKRFPLQLDEYSINEENIVYNADLSSLFGKGKNLGLDDEPKELPFDNEDINLWNIISILILLFIC